MTVPQSDAPISWTHVYVGGVWVPVSATNPLPVSVSLSGVVVAEDSVHTNGASMLYAGGVRNDALSSLVGADGDFTGFMFNLLNALYVQPTTGPRGSWTPFRFPALSTTAQTIKAGAGTIGTLFVGNAANYAANAEVVQVHFYDTVGTVTVGSDTPDFSVELEKGLIHSDGAGLFSFTTGCKIAATIEDGSTAPTGNVLVSGGFK